jgi:hypothetical protein
MPCNDQVFFEVSGKAPMNNEDEEDDQEDAATEVVSPQDRFLVKDPQGLWELGPLPEGGSVLRVHLANALHSYITQQWSE